MQPTPGDGSKLLCNEVSQSGSDVEQAGEVGKSEMGLLVRPFRHIIICGGFENVNEGY